jgi:tetratricopeptide (TPR) repeat protein
VIRLRLRLRLRLRVCLFGIAACSASATLPDLAAAEHSEDAGDTDGAIAHYRAAQSSCHQLRPARRAKAACGSAHRTDAAITTYLAIPARAGDDGETAATALYRAGDLLLHQQRTTDAWTALWKVITDYPDQAAAADAVKLLLDDGRGRAAQQLADEFGKLLTSLAETQVADNLAWSLADLYAHELANPSAARAFYDRIPADFPTSGLKDDARWYAAQLSEQLGDPKGAVVRLKALLATREVAIGPGSYFSVWLDDAQLELGKVLRDSLHDLPGAAAAFRQLPKDYPASILRDDALFELAVTLGQAGDTSGRCAAESDLKKLEPDSKYVPRLPELGACP